MKEELLIHHDLVLTDILGSTEGDMASSVATRGVSPSVTAQFDLADGVIVITDEGELVEPGSGKIGRLATSASIPIGYFEDSEKAKATFKEIDGVRYLLSGDYATIGLDGTIAFLGQGSVCINTPGGKVFAEEVEEVVKKLEGIADCLVVGIPDEDVEERVIAVVSCEEDFSVEESLLSDFSGQHLPGYKVPKGFVFVMQVRRSPNGKGDYRWARETAVKNYG